MPVSLGWSADRALLALLDALDEGALVFDERHHCRGAGRRIAELLGTDSRSLIGLARTDIVDRLAAASRSPESVRALDDEAITSGSTIADPIELGEPEPRILVWTSLPIADPAGIVGRIDLFRDVTRERELGRRLDLATTVDVLTGLVNRRRFEEECQREHRRSQRAWLPYALVRVDVDGMSQINLAHGKKGGDAVLALVADELKATRREYDLVARWENDEFVVLLPGVDARSAKKVLRRALARVHEACSALLGEKMTVCTGVAVWVPPSGEMPVDLVERAGKALAIARARRAGSLEIDPGEREWKDDTSTEDS